MHRNFQTCSTTETRVALERSMTANNSFSLLLVCKSGCPLKTSGILSPFTNKQVADFETLDERQAGTTEEFLTLPTHSPQLFLSFVVPQSSLHLSTTAESHFLFFFFLKPYPHWLPHLCNHLFPYTQQQTLITMLQNVEISTSRVD